MKVTSDEVHAVVTSALFCMVGNSALILMAGTWR